MTKTKCPYYPCKAYGFKKGIITDSCSYQPEFQKECSLYKKYKRGETEKVVFT